MGQGDSARDFDPSESMEHVGILDVFPIFHTARLGQKIRRSPPLPLCGVALIVGPVKQSPAISDKITEQGTTTGYNKAIKKKMGGLKYVCYQCK